MVNHRTKQVETLISNLEVLDPKLKALGVVEVKGAMTYVVGGEVDDYV